MLYRQGSDQLYYRGMVRLEVSTQLIVAQVRKAQVDLVRIVLVIAAIALGIGIAGAFILSTIIVVPIRKLVKQIEHIRDTEDKEELAGTSITVKGRDELFALANTINQMTDGLVHAAKASKELIVGKGIQKMFIPLDSAQGTQAKLSTGHRDEKDFEVYGYYEGADAVSGDYWDFRSINARYHYFIKCDVSGHGVSAALIMVQVATMVINYFNDWKKAMPKAIDLTDLTYKINDFLEERQFKGPLRRLHPRRMGLAGGGGLSLRGGATASSTCGDAKRGMLVEEDLPDSPAAGPFPSFMVQMKQPFVQLTRKLEPGDALLLYTDGIDEANRHFRDKDFKLVTCEAVPKEEPHENHKGGADNEEFGYERICAVLEALHARTTYRLVKHHAPDPGEALSFDFSGCDGSLEEMVIALVAVEKIFRMYRDPHATDQDTIVVDAKVDDFLRKKRRFDQVRLFLGPDAPDGSNPERGAPRGLEQSRLRPLQGPEVGSPGRRPHLPGHPSQVGRSPLAQGRREPRGYQGLSIRKQETECPGETSTRGRIRARAALAAEIAALGEPAAWLHVDRVRDLALDDHELLVPLREVGLEDRAQEGLRVGVQGVREELVGARRLDAPCRGT